MSREPQPGNPRRRAVLLGGLGALALPRSLSADDFLADATLRLIVSSSGGGSMESAGRLFARHLQARLPATRVAVELMGKANGRVAGLTLWQAKPDGLTLGMLNSNLIYSRLTGEEDLPFDLLGFDWVGSLTRDRRLLAVSLRSGLDSVEALLARREPLLLAAVAFTSGHATDAFMLNGALGTLIRPVPGYSAGQRLTAMISGETDCAIGSFESLQPLLEAGAARLLLALNQGPLPAPHVPPPQLVSYLPTDRRWVVDLVDAQCALGRSVAAPPGIDPARLARLRALFDEIAADPAFVAEATAAGMHVEPTGGDALGPLLRQLREREADLATDFRALIACGRALAEGGGC